MKAPSARCSRAAAPRRNDEARARQLRAGLEVEAERRAEVDMVARRKPNCALGSPQRRTSTLPRSSAPAGTSACGRLGSAISMRAAVRPGRLRAARPSAFSSSPMPCTSAISAPTRPARPCAPGRSLRQQVAARLQLLGARLHRLALGLQRARKRSTSRNGCGGLRASSRATTPCRSLRSRLMSSMGRRRQAVRKAHGRRIEHRAGRAGRRSAAL